MTELLWPCPALRAADLSARTTIRVGGEAEWLLEPRDPAELVSAFHAARERGYEPRVLGGGANLLVPDGLIPGVVITTEGMVKVFRPEPGGGAEAGAELDPQRLVLTSHERESDPSDSSDPCIIAWAGCSLPGLVRVTRDLGWSGFEGLAGVPGHLGGGIAMNAGGRWGETWDVVERVRVLDGDGTVRELERAHCAPRYRDGNLGGAIVLAAVLRFRVDDPAAVRERVATYLREKGAVQPVSERSCGCVFRNPDRELSGGRSAGQLIEAAGARGLERGGALVSEKHGNFIVNRGRARARDVLELMEEVRARVADRFGIRLENEVKVWAA
jgi:UDP-N-acetylmuramate dehydrogenase